MQLKHEFVVDAPLERAWRLLDQLDKVVPCMPGASYLGQDGDSIRVGMKVKVGVIAFNFAGQAQFIEKNPATHTVVVKGNAKDAGGKGATTAVITTVLKPASPQATHVALLTELAMSGRVAQFGSSMLQEISSRLVKQFADNLHQLLIVEQAPAATPKQIVMSAAKEQGPPPASPGTHGALDLGGMFTGIVLRWIRKPWVVAIVSFVLGWAVRGLLG